jgi:hypothetical protein
VSIRDNARQRLRELDQDTDALNFLGIADSAAGDLHEAKNHWWRSSELGDPVAPLLLHLVTQPLSPRGPGGTSSASLPGQSL